MLYQITEVSLSAFVYSLFHEDFFPINETNVVETQLLYQSNCIISALEIRYLCCLFN